MKVQKFFSPNEVIILDVEIMYIILRVLPNVNMKIFNLRPSQENYKEMMTCMSLRSR